MNCSDDPLSLAVYNYYFHNKNIPVRIYSRGFDVDEIAPSYFFRLEDEMPIVERKALEWCQGKILDIGACSGCHTLPLLSRKFDVTALEKSPLCCEVLKNRGVKNVIQQDIYDFYGDRFDTLLLLMNGTGIAGTLKGLDRFLIKLKDLLLPGGQILMDSSDLIYLYTEDDGSVFIDLNAEHYYGELVYQTGYQDQKGQEFPWLYVDQDLLATKAEQNGLLVDQVYTGENCDYLARLILK